MKSENTNQLKVLKQKRYLLQEHVYCFFWPPFLWNFRRNQEAKLTTAMLMYLNFLKSIFLLNMLYQEMLSMFSKEIDSS